MAALLKSIFCPSGDQSSIPSAITLNNQLLTPALGDLKPWPPEVAVHIMTEAGSSLFQESQSYKQQQQQKN